LAPKQRSTGNRALPLDLLLGIVPKKHVQAVGRVQQIEEEV